MTNTIHIDERECAFTHDGQTFTASGAYIDNDYANIYAIDDERGERSSNIYRDWALYARASGITQTWQGERVGSWVATSQYWGGFRSRMRSIRVTLDDGRVYAGRYAPDSGDFVRCKRIKSKGGSK